MAKVSILMNGYNAEKYLKKAIDSIYSQTYSNWEIVFIDNCSTDNTKKIIDSYDNRIKYYTTDKTVPLGAARNLGLEYCKGEYIAFLDTDDIWLPEKLEIQVKAMDKNIDCQLCYSGVIYIDENGKDIGSLIPEASSGNVLPQQLRRYEINMQSVILRNNIGQIKVNEELKYSPDFNLFMNIVSNSSAYVIKEYLVKYRKLSSSLTSKSIDRWWLEMKITLDEIFSTNPILKSKYPLEYKMAYAKVSYYKARYLMSLGKRKEARDELSKVKDINKVYFLLYFISLFPIKIWDLVHYYKERFNI